MSEEVRIPPLVTLRTLREVVGLTSPQLAERIAEHGFDIHPDSILNVELGRKGASGPLLAAWAKAYGAVPGDIWPKPDLVTKVLAHLEYEASKTRTEQVA